MTRFQRQIANCGETRQVTTREVVEWLVRSERDIEEVLSELAKWRYHVPKCRIIYHDIGNADKVWSGDLVGIRVVHLIQKVRFAHIEAKSHCPGITAPDSTSCKVAKGNRV